MTGLVLGASLAGAQVIPSPGTTCDASNNCSTGNASSLPAIVNIFNGTGTQTSVNGSVSGSLTVSGTPLKPYVVQYVGMATTNDNYQSTTQAPFQQGPIITLTNSATINWSNIFAGQYTGAVFAQSVGAKGTSEGEHNLNVSPPAAYNGGNGGAVTIGHSGAITISGLVSFEPGTIVASGLLGLSQGGVGGAYDTRNFCCAGSGGNGGLVSVSTEASSSITLTGAFANLPVAGIQALSLGGQAATADFAGPGFAAGVGGNGGEVDVTHAGVITNTVGGVGILAASVGGSGNTTSGTPTLAGGGGQVTVDLSGSSAIGVSGSQSRASIGVFATSSAGRVSGDSPQQGGGNVTVNVSTASTIAASGGSAFNVGVLAVSSGSASILEPFATSGTVTASGTATSGTVTVANNGSIQASGASALGIAAFSVGGAGIVTSTSSGSGLSYLGNSSSTAGYHAGGAGVLVTNTGTIATNGTSGHGILAASSGGGGILSTDLLPANAGGVWTSGVILGASTPAGAPGQNAGAVTVTNSGIIRTGDIASGGLVAMGIVAQSIGGGGGSFAGSGVAAFVGDNGGGGGDGGQVTVGNSGQIITNNDGAVGILAQSVGGGGGNGANAGGVFVAVGGEGGGGGTAGQVAVANAAGGTISTTGDFAAGIVAQSIGGGGGNGGYAISAGLFVGAAIGGTGGGGGGGGAVLASNLGTIATTGQHSLGLLAQSVGGGGGNGGAAHSYVVGVGFAVNLAIGGTGGSGGDGGAVALNNVNTLSSITTSGADAIGLVAQSVGGGGGTGGASVARTVAISLPGVPAFSFTGSLGGSGGGGGNGGAVTARNAASISTSGDGGHAILVQSVGGGGGNGGDSTAATYAVAVGSPQVNVTLALGASGGNGGSGGAVTFGNGATVPSGSQVAVPSGFFSACAPCTSTIATAGNNAAAILVQSIGGGGGNSTAGNATNDIPLSNFGDDTYQFSLGLGAKGGTGALGGAVTVGVDASTTIVTTGSGSVGIIAQSVGGGGGSSSGGSFGMSGATFGLSNDSYQAHISLGGNGVSGGDGGTVAVTNAASITTGRGDSIGILAQSIGGGGGLAGSSDAAATISAVNQIENTVKPAAGVNYSAQLAIGGKGGGGGNGGTVGVANTGAITTGGVRAYGIEAQSVGGGGGNGGSATANATGTTSATVSANLALGGSGGTGGTGGAITVTDSAAIVTNGYNAHGILAQSIGGGGGVGSDGSVASTSTLSLGVGAGGGAGGSGNGGQVSVSTNPGGAIVTRGDDAAGVLAQSIGGGGGTGSFGCGNSCLTSVGTLNTAYAGMPIAYQLRLGDLTGSGDGGAVTVAVGDRIVTTGARAMAIVAQSIGGGGGFAPAAAQTVGSVVVFSNAATTTTTTTSGGAVAVTLDSSGGIFTRGAGAWGILAQSIGAGGGFAGDSSLNLIAPRNGGNTGVTSSFGGDVQVNVNGNIVTTGANAHGVVAQSIGGGGGLVGGDGLAANATLQAFGNTGSADLLGVAGQVKVVQGSGSKIVTTGVGSIGIFTQAAGSDVSSPSSVTISGTVIGGTNNGYDFSNGGIGAAGIVMSGKSPGNSIAVNPGGFVGTMDGVDGTAILAPQSAVLIQNSGTITGSIDTTGGTIANGSGGVLNTGATINAATLTNSGTVNVFGIGAIGTTTVGGNFVQNSSGNLVVGIDTQAGRADLLKMTGTASLAGTLTPVPLALLPGSAQVISAAGGITGNVTLASSLLFKWNGFFTGAGGVNTGYSIAATANFAPGGVTLTSSQQSLVSNLVNAWNNADPAYARKFAYLSQINSPGAYAAVLEALSPKATQAQSAAMVNNAGTMLGAAMSCPVFVDQTVLLGEDNCVWSKITGQRTTQGASSDIQGYQVSGVTYRLGAQHAFAPNWYLGGSLAVSQTWATMDGGSSSSGQIFDGSISLKHTMGPWLFAGSISLASGAFHSNRVVSLPGGGGVLPANATLQADQSLFMAGGRLRAAYEFAFDNWYLRPYGDFDVIYANAPGFRESGQSDFALNVYESSKTSIALSPMVEFGGRIPVGEKTTLRPFVAAGVRFLPDNGRYVDASLVGALPGTGTFRTYSELPSVLANVDVGVQFYRAGGFEARAEYGLKTGGSYLSQTAGARVAYHF